MTRHRFALLSTITCVLLVSCPWTFAKLKRPVLKNEVEWGKKGVRNLTCYYCDDNNQGGKLIPDCKNAQLVTCDEPFAVCTQGPALNNKKKEISAWERANYGTNMKRDKTLTPTKSQRGCGKWRDDVELGCPPAFTQECQCRMDKCNIGFDIVYNEL